MGTWVQDAKAEAARRWPGDARAERIYLWSFRPTWELRNMKRALSFGAAKPGRLVMIINTEEENQRLAEVTAALKLKRKEGRR